MGSSLNDLQAQLGEMRLLEHRSLFISEGVHSGVAKTVVTNLLNLDADAPGKDIFLYLNSPGGEVTSGFAIYDTIRFLNSKVTIINTGLCASIATIINVSVPKERRLSMPNAKFLIHQPLISGQVQGPASDIEITAIEIMKTREKINKVLAEACGQTVKKIEEDGNRDYWMNASQALEYGLIGKIVSSAKELK